MSSYKEKKEAIRNKQSNMSYEDVKAILARRSDYMFEMDNVQPQQHNWIDRGAKLSCENAGHPHHSAFKRKVVMQ